MICILDPRQYKHNPKYFMSLGATHPSPEVPKRVDILSNAAQAAGYRTAEPEDYGITPIAAVHSNEYLHFLRNIHSRWKRVPGASDEVIPNIHPANRRDSYPQSATGQAGYHQADTACPIGEHTWESAYWAAQSALSGAEALHRGERKIYALARPPGHHAFADMAGGFCFLNNSAIAAERLNQLGHRVAILDVDVHHGNGTQGIFYNRSDIFTVSLHADPSRFYPFFWGHPQERGEGEGLGANLNIALPRKTADEDYLKALDGALERIDAFGATALVVALGLDAHENDPFQGLAISTDGFARIAARIADLGRPTLHIQEGGYVSDDLGLNLESYLSGFQPNTE